MKRGEIWWAELAAPRGSEPGYRRPLVIVQADGFNRSGIHTVIGVALSTNMLLAEMPGNVSITADASGLPEDSIANVTQIITIDKRFLEERAGSLPRGVMREIDAGLMLVLSLADV